MMPQLRDTGWTVTGGVYRHSSGATFERRAYLDEKRRRLVFEARINGGEWHEVKKERFHETLARALKAHRRRRAAA